MKKPIAQKDQLSTIWDTVIGNGKPGLVDDVKAMIIDMGDMKGDVSYIKGRIDGMAGAPTRKTVTFRRIIETVIYAVAISGAIFLAVMFAIGKMTADDVANILRASRGVQ